ncbi:hypothetical protein DIPPA_10257 [Diplonema papillatum]|nr:hypothetical protein DIPPA_10257 [Diplonema papillatum]
MQTVWRTQSRLRKGTEFYMRFRGSRAAGAHVHRELPVHVKVNDTGIDVSSVLRGGGVGFATGLMGSMAGLGGGPFCVPLLGYAVGLTHQQCIGTSLVCALSTLTVGGVTTYLAAGSPVSVLPIAVLAAIAPVFGYAASTRCRHIADASLKRLFAFFLLGSAGMVFGRVLIWNGTEESTNPTKQLLRSMVATPEGTIAFHAVLAAVAGTCSGLLGIAGGSVVVPLMSLADVASWQAITTTSLISMIPTSLASLSAHYRMGNVVRPLVPSLVVGTCVGAFTGPKLLANVDEDTRKLVCATVLLVTSIVMFVK